MRSHPTLFALGLLGVVAALPGAAYINITDCANSIILNHELEPDGTSMHNWHTKGRVNFWPKPSSATSIVHWGQVYEAEGGNGEWNARVAVRRCRTYLRYNNTWYLDHEYGNSTSKPLNGGHYWEDFHDNNAVSPGDKLWNSGLSCYTVSSGCAAANVANACSRNYHFFSYPTSGWAVPISTSRGTLKGWISTCEFKLTDDPNTNPNYNNAKYVVGVGADWYGNNGWIGDVAIGRHLKATTSWRKAYATNLSKSELQAVPPP